MTAFIGRRTPVSNMTERPPEDTTGPDADGETTDVGVAWFAKVGLLFLLVLAVGVGLGVGLGVVPGL